MTFAHQSKCHTLVRFYLLCFFFFLVLALLDITLFNKVSADFRSIVPDRISATTCCYISNIFFSLSSTHITSVFVYVMCTITRIQFGKIRILLEKTNLPPKLQVTWICHIIIALQNSWTSINDEAKYKLQYVCCFFSTNCAQSISSYTRINIISLQHQSSSKTNSQHQKPSVAFANHWFLKFFLDLLSIWFFWLKSNKPTWSQRIKKESNRQKI